jgi:hypothetical protein
VPSPNTARSGMTRIGMVTPGNSRPIAVVGPLQRAPAGERVPRGSQSRPDGRRLAPVAACEAARDAPGRANLLYEGRVVGRQGGPYIGERRSVRFEDISRPNVPGVGQASLGG